jgi:ElaB/YqjD/DUF883 family membrane-anchored ribosome-binding protein
MKKKHKTGALNREYHKFINDIESMLQETANLTGDELTLARTKLNERVKEARGSATTIGNDLALRASKGAAKANRKVHDDPWKAVGGAAAAGLILGMLFTLK